MRKFLLLSMACIGLTVSVYAQSYKNLWKVKDESSLSQKAKSDLDKHFKPVAYKFFSLNEDQLRTSLTGTSSYKSVPVSKSGKIISIPDANGLQQQFRIAEASVLEPQLAAKYPGIKTYIGQGINDKTAIIHFDVTPSGFHAVVTSALKPTYYINPVDRANSIYIVNARNTGDKSSGFTCSMDKSLLAGAGITGKTSTITGNTDDGKLRTYDLALCVNGEFSQTFLDGTESSDAERTAKVMDVLTTCIVRANAVYERDFGIHLQYVAKEDTLIFLDPNTDPWPTKPPLLGSSWNSKTQQTIDARIGSGNYDVGHLLGKVPTFSDNNGNAGCIGCVCTNGSKGSGFSAYNDPTLIDYMVIDYWTHEMGHQFGANHTFDFSNEGTQAQIEPGSGSTIMGYAGITGSTDVQPHSDDLFSTVSIAQVSNNIKPGGNSSSCAVVTNTGDIAPIANAGADYTIPKSTPFLLTGSGTDADAGDVLTYIWEQSDVFEKTTSNKFPMATSTTGPVFRVFNDTTITTRTFPELSSILSGQNGSTWEVLPSVARDLNFRFTVRDNHAGGGNNKTDAMVVTVSGTAGPFIVSQPNTNVNWPGESQQTILWDVASTNAAPVSCGNVKISLSIDGGITFPIMLVASTPNDGSQVVTLPAVNSTLCRIKVEAIGNIFFDISDANFTISGVAPQCPGQYDLGNNDNLAHAIAIPLNTDVYGTINTSTDKDFYKFTITTGGTVSITLINLPADYDLALYNSSNTIIAQSKTTGNASEAISTTLAAGDYTVRVKGKNNAFDTSNCYLLKVAAGTASRSITAVSSDAVSSAGGIKIYPNPASSLLYITLPVAAFVHELKIYDINGRLVAVQKSSTHNIQFDISKIPSGVYFVKVTNVDGSTAFTSGFTKQ